MIRTGLFGASFPIPIGITDFALVEKSQMTASPVPDIIAELAFRGVAQLVEHWSPKPGVAGSSPVSPAKKKVQATLVWAFLL